MSIGSDIYGVSSCDQGPTYPPGWRRNRDSWAPWLTVTRFGGLKAAYAAVQSATAARSIRGWKVCIFVVYLFHFHRQVAHRFVNGRADQLRDFGGYALHPFQVVRD